MDQRASGIILRVRPYSETSLIVHWLTRDSGRVATMAKGAKRPKSPFRGKLDLFFSADFSYQPSRKSELHTLRELELQETFSGIRSQLGRLQCASYFCALIELVTESETPIPEVHQLMLDALRFLQDHDPGPLIVFAFEIKLMEQQGVGPALGESRLSLGCRRILEQAVESDWAFISRLKITSAQENELVSFLRFALAQGFERVLPARDSLFSDLSD